MDDPARPRIQTVEVDPEGNALAGDPPPTDTPAPAQSVTEVPQEPAISVPPPEPVVPVAPVSPFSSEPVTNPLVERPVVSTTQETQPMDHSIPDAHDHVFPPFSVDAKPTPQPPVEPPAEPTQPPLPSGEPAVVAPIPPETSPMPGIAATPPEGKKSIKSFTFIIPAVLLVATIIIVSIIASRSLSNQATPSAPQPTLSTVLVPATPVPTLAPVSQLKSYSNPDLQFGFSFPDTLAAIECSGGVKLVSGSNDLDARTGCNEAPLGIITIEHGRELFPREYSETDGFQVDERAVVIGGIDAVLETVTKTGDAAGLAYAEYATFEREGVYYRLSLQDKDNRQVFADLMESFAFAEDITKDWETHTNTAFQYSVKYPAEWTLLTESAEAAHTEIRLKADQPKVQTLVIEASNEGSNADLSAKDVVQSTKSLSGWEGTPTVDIRSIGGGTAYLLQGQYNGNWQTYVIIWYKSRLVQMNWVDILDQAEQDTFDGFLASFQFQG